MFSIRKAKLGDEASIARIQYELNLQVYESHIPKFKLESDLLEALNLKWRDEIRASVGLESKRILMVSETSTQPGLEPPPVIGFLSGEVVENESQTFDAKISLLAVQRNWQGQGLEHQLIHSFTKEMTQRGCHSVAVQVPVNSPMQRFYESIGARFEIVFPINGEKASSFPVLSFVWKDLSALLEQISTSKKSSLKPKVDRNYLDSISTLPVFKELTQSELIAICNIAEIRTLNPKECLNQEGVPSKEVQIILSGEAEISIRGVRLDSILLIRGNLLGEISFFSGMPYIGTPIARTKVEVLVINHQTLRILLERNPTLGMKIYRAFTLEIVRKLTGSFEQVADLVLGDPSKQLAHDIQSPLQALKILSTKLTETLTPERALLDLVVGRIERIASTLLKPFATTARSVPEDRNSLNVTTLEAVSQMMRVLVAEKKLQINASQPFKEIEFEVVLADGGAMVSVDSTQFERVISNLIDNSLQSNASQVRVDTLLTSSETSAIIKIKDDGKGIPPDILYKLGKFKITSGKENGNGNGIGLLHAHRQIESWGGSIQIKSIENRGTEVSITLPLLKNFKSNTELDE